MCTSGGGDGGRGAAEEANREAEEKERLRQERIAQTQTAINSTFDNPMLAKQRASIADSIFEDRARRLQQQETDALRRAKFALARTGGLGGSQQLSAEDKIQDRSDQEILNSSNVATQAANRAYAEDESLRQNLLSRAAAGEDQAALLEAAATQQAVNLANAQNQFASKPLGDIFAGVESLFTGAQFGATNQIAKNRFNNLIGADQQTDNGLFFEEDDSSIAGAISKLG